ncbi:hypothetical protein INT47_005954 [Mucor saturninus]|uniref:F-box domain-containing protein n=1 Tax=Mucor saturninus TaxID=64648 RepID=A0A8H7R711_9FUNG|nr:hypothetical protein INT47_005954 [Mucor saturninus]
MSFETLPNEILIQVFGLLHRNDVHSLMHVCKQWHMAAVLLYFQKIRVIEKHIKADSLFINGNFTQELTIYRGHTTKDPLREKESDKSTFLKLLSCLPNLEKIDIQSRTLPNQYMSILRELINTDTYPQRIEEISFYSHCPKERVSHFLSCYNFRKSIRRLETQVSSDFLISTTSKSLCYFLPQFTYLTQLTYSCSQEDDVTLFDILLCCENIVDFKYSSRYPIPSRASSQVGATCNKHLKRLTISSPIGTSAYINYVRTMQPLDYLNLTIERDGYEIFQVIEPFADVFQKFKEFRIDFNGGEYSSIPSSFTSSFYSVLCKLKCDRRILYDATFTSSECTSDDILVVRDDELSFRYIMREYDSRSFVEKHDIIDRQQIVKGLTFTEIRSSLTDILNYSKTFPQLETLYIQLLFLHSQSVQSSRRPCKNETLRFHILQVRLWRFPLLQKNVFE